MGQNIHVAVSARTVSACWLLCHHRAEAILIEMLQPKRYCLLVKSPSRLQHSGGDN